MANSNIKIDRINFNGTGFKPNTLYCFNRNFDSTMCKRCLSRQECDNEKSKNIRMIKSITH